MIKKVKITKLWKRPIFEDVIDVRTPSEYAEDHIIGSVNYPVLYNEQRSLIGKTYKQVNPFKAKIIGSSIIAKNIAIHIEKNFQNKSGSWKPLIYCWRGGQRSRALALILQEIGWQPYQLYGGYKKYRQDVMDLLNNLSPKLKLWSIGGKTGTAKTKILSTLEKLGGQVLDLEQLANHKGSLLGKINNSPQPSQKLFESLILNKIQSFKLNKIIFIESESSKIGNLHIPKELWKNMFNTKQILIEAPIQSRVNFLIRDYNYLINNDVIFENLIKGLEKRMHKEIIDEWKKNIKSKNWKSLAHNLLNNHYDPAYTRSNKSKNNKIKKVFKINDVNQKSIKYVAEELIKSV